MCHQTATRVRRELRELEASREAGVSEVTEFVNAMEKKRQASDCCTLRIVSGG
jgi:hypothetical protein